MAKISTKLIDNFKNIYENYIKKDLKMKMLVTYLTINLLYILIGSYIYFTEKIISGFHYKEFSIGLKYLFIVNVIIFIVIFIKKKYKKNIIHIGIALAIVFAIISTIFAINNKLALEGCWGRYEGLFSILYYLTLMLLSTFVSKKYKKFLVKVILVCGTIQALYAICQSYSLFNVKQYWGTYKYYNESVKGTIVGRTPMILGFTNHSNFFGAYMVLCISYSIGLIIDSKKVKNIVIYCILSALFTFAILICNTASSAIGLIVVLIYTLIYAIKNRLFKKIFIIFIIILSVTVLAIKLDKTRIIKELGFAGKQAVEITKGNVDDNYGTKRIYIWKETIKIIPDNLIHGVGIDNFNKAFNGSALILKTKGKDILYDKVHNEYLQTLVTQGIFALVSYLFIYGLAVLKGTKDGFKNREIYLVLPVIGYLVQAFFNISVIEVAPIFYMALGLCCSKT